MEVINKKLDELKEYNNNPRVNINSVELVAKSIEEFGFKVPIIIDKDGVIVAGHTRYKASQLLGLDEVPCIVADDLTEEQINSFRIIDNKTSEYARWDYALLEKELEGINEIDMSDFGFSTDTIDWDGIEEIGEDNYEEPEAKKCQCPYCNHIDAKWRFLKVNVE